MLSNGVGMKSLMMVLLIFLVIYFVALGITEVAKLIKRARLKRKGIDPDAVPEYDDEGNEIRKDA